MNNTADITNREPDTLCERCGYILKVINEAGTCPECGWPIRYSLRNQRHPCAFEVKPTISNFFITTFSVLLRPGHFYTDITTRENTSPARWFARIHRALAAILLSLAAAGQVCLNRDLTEWFRSLLETFSPYFLDEPVLFSVLLLPFALIIYALLTLLTLLAARLTSGLWAYRGTARPPGVALRGLSFHTAHLVPPALMLAVTVCGLMTLLNWNYVRWFSVTVWRVYHIMLTCELVLLIAHPFATYCIAMEHMKYANR